LPSEEDFFFAGDLPGAPWIPGRVHQKLLHFPNFAERLAVSRRARCRGWNLMRSGDQAAVVDHLLQDLAAV
jgi:hypothetical protein